MGNLNCCTSQQGQIETGIESINQQQNFTTVDPDHKQRSEVTEEQIREETQYITECADTRKAQQTEFPDISYTRSLQNRIHGFQPALIKCLKEISHVLPFITLIVDPSENVVALKEVLFKLKNALSSLNQYWIGIYESHSKKETIEFLQSLEQNLEFLHTFFTQLQKKADSVEKKEGVEEVTFSKVLAEDENQKKVEQDFVKELNKYFLEFNEYASVRNIFENNKDLLEIEFIQHDLKSSLPAYVRAHFRSFKGFNIWSEMFGANIDVSKDEFIIEFAKRSEMEHEHIKFILEEIASPYETISFFEFVHFIRVNDQYFNTEGLICKTKHQEVKEISAKFNQQKKQEVPKKIDDNKYEYSSGAIYSGELVDNLMSGRGKLIFQEYSYDGEFKEGQPEGHGIEVKFGVKYEGKFSKGLFHGDGSLTFPDGTVYNGLFDQNKYNGKGQLVDFNGVMYSGIWVNGKLNMGEITYSTGEVYTGEILNNRFKHGQGTLQANANGASIFEGEFRFDEPSKGKLFQGKHLLFEGELNLHATTYGTYYYQGGSYTGNMDMATHFRTEKGTLKWLQIQEIEGTWFRDQPTIATNFFDVNNKEARYEGQWTNFNRNGKGTFFYASRAKYEGDVSNNLRVGHGKYTYPNGNIYEGGWDNNNFNGKGVFSFINGDVYTGEFKDGQFHGQGKYVYANKKSYEGQWANDKWNGKGKYCDEHGVVQKEGEWKDDKLIQA